MNKNDRIGKKVYRNKKLASELGFYSPIQDGIRPNVNRWRWVFILGTAMLIIGYF